MSYTSLLSLCLARTTARVPCFSAECRFSLKIQNVTNITLVSFTVDFYAGLFRGVVSTPLKCLGESLPSQPLELESRKALHPHAGRIACLRCEWLQRRRDVGLLSNKVVDNISDLCMLLIAEYFFPHLKSTFLRPSNKLIQKLW